MRKNQRSNFSREIEKSSSSLNLLLLSRIESCRIRLTRKIVKILMRPMEDRWLSLTSYPLHRLQHLEEQYSHRNKAREWKVYWIHYLVTLQSLLYQKLLVLYLLHEVPLEVTWHRGRHHRHNQTIHSK